MCQALQDLFVFVAGVLGVPTSKIIVFGRSCGSGPSTLLARTQPGIAGLVLQSPFTSIRGVGRAKVGLLASIVLDRFPNDRNIAEIRCPLAIIHGRNDRLVPCQQGQALYDLSPSTSKSIHILEGVGHQGFGAASGEFFKALREFQERVGLDKLDEALSWTPAIFFAAYGSPKKFEEYGNETAKESSDSAASLSSPSADASSSSTSVGAVARVMRGLLFSTTATVAGLFFSSSS